MVWVMKVEVILFSVSFHVVICLETHWLSHFLAKWETRWWTKTLADCGRHFVCAFHLVHRAVLHFAYFCSALPPSLVFINVTAVWLSTNCPFCVCVCVCVCGCHLQKRRGPCISAEILQCKWTLKKALNWVCIWVIFLQKFPQSQISMNTK